MKRRIELSRRTFLGASAAAGFTLAVRPLSAATILTDDSGLDGGDVAIPAGDRSIPAYRAMPAGKSGLTTIVIVHEVFGVHEHIRDLCRRLAKTGYLAVAPDLFARHGDAPRIADREELMRVVSSTSDAQVFADLDATLAWCASHHGAKEKAGITGFCWGGRIVWLYAARTPSLGAGVAWYGRLQPGATPLQPQSPLDVAETLRVPVLGLYGGTDAGIPLAGVEQMRKALAAGKSGSEIVVYPKAGHAFNADYRDSYDAAAATDGWQRMLAWFARYCPGAPIS